ncbi:1611_t:CDS:2 [Acaulospora morrowiae]|uniref:1611_t:CDS:1 n=1 Tax=Acaulospora morrowiae TaxID=94023 RepID=A0A9N9H523_9GLOM|nr:1611_t:CDS:2 [Acaulospora morrowiae]
MVWLKLSRSAVVESLGRSGAQSTCHKRWIRWHEVSRNWAKNVDIPGITMNIRLAGEFDQWEDETFEVEMDVAFCKEEIDCDDDEIGVDVLCVERIPER